MKRITIIHKNNAASYLPKVISANSSCYYLSDDYWHFTVLKDSFKEQIEIKSLSGLFNKTFQEIKGAVLDMIVRINKRNNALYWWGSQMASRNPASSQLTRNITYLLCVKRLLSDSHHGQFIFIVDNRVLSVCMRTFAEELGYQAILYRRGMRKYVDTIKLLLFYCVRILYFIWQSFQSRSAALKLLTPMTAPKMGKAKRIVIRSWITKDTFDKLGRFKDRNFGLLPEWLRSKGYDVWILPMFFNLSMSLKEIYALMRKQEQCFLIPDHYLKIRDYLWVLYNGYRIVRTKIAKVVVEGIDMAPLFVDELKQEGFKPPLLIFNLCYPMLKRLRERGVEIDGFYYPFESNPPEKQFILGCRTFFPRATILGFQHTAFFTNQLAYQLDHSEIDYHPLPDKIISSGSIYVRLLKESGFPQEILVEGSNLRFESVYVNNMEHTADDKCIKEKLVLLPLTFSHDLAFELFVKVREALMETRDYKVRIRSHLLLSNKMLVKFLNEIGMNEYEFADEGIIQDWFIKSHAVISTGGSITILEAVAAGVPVIRVVPDSTFFFDPFSWQDYPLKPVNSSAEIRQQLQFISETLKNDGEMFSRIGKQVLKEYFTKPDEENLKIFL